MMSSTAESLSMKEPSRPLRIAFAGFNLESVSFLSAQTTVQDFEKVALRGTAILNAYRGSNTVAGGVIEVCEREQVHIEPIVHTLLGALGPTSDAAVDFYCDEIVNAVAALEDRVDGVLLFLHGACWAPGYPDPERHIIDSVRAVLGSKRPIIVALDYHANLDAQTLAGANAAFAYRKSPHTDTGDTGRRAAQCLVRTLRGEIQPTWALAKPHVLIPSIFSATNLQPLASIIDKALALEQASDDYMDITVLGGFSYADAANTGMAVVCVTDNDPESAARVVRELSADIADQKAAIYRPLPTFGVAAAVAQVQSRLAAGTARRGPYVLLEHADRMNDSTYVLQELLRVGARKVAAPFLWDSIAAQQACAAGVGSTVRLALGGHSSDKAGPTLDVDAQVLWCGLKRYKVSGTYMQGSPVDLGLTALVQIEGVMVSIVSAFAFAVDDDPFRIFGLNLHDFDIVLLRSKTHFRAFYESVAEDILIVDTPDYGVADLRTLPYRQVDQQVNYPFTGI